jgi:hypothetical protein
VDCTEWGLPGGSDYQSDSGFEEWTVKKYPFLDVTKTAETTLGALSPDHR